MEESEEEFYTCFQALPVRDFDESQVDLNTPPLNAQEYMEQVMVERRLMPSVVTKPIPNNIANEQTISNLFKELNLGNNSEKSKYKVNPLRQVEIVANFSTVRSNVEEYRFDWEVKYFDGLPQNKEAWFEFCFGKSPKKGFISEDGKMPLMSLLYEMDNELLLRLLYHLVNWVVNEEVSVYQCGPWLYAMLACADLPFLPSTTKRLRILASKCRELREKENPNGDEFAKREINAQTLFICIIGKFFCQHDLAD